jgi:hypothetical protein
MTIPALGVGTVWVVVSSAGPLSDRCVGVDPETGLRDPDQFDVRVAPTKVRACLPLLTEASSDGFEDVVHHECSGVS